MKDYADRLVDLATEAQKDILDRLEVLSQAVEREYLSEQARSVPLSAECCGVVMSTMTLTAAQLLIQLGVHPHVFFTRVAVNVNEMLAELRTRAELEKKS